MPSLYSLRPDFAKLSYEEQTLFIRVYRKRREDDMLKPATYGTEAAKAKAENIRFGNTGLTPEEISIAKALGLSVKDLKILKANRVSE
jgi:hypothetical protein